MRKIKIEIVAEVEDDVTNEEIENEIYDDLNVSGFYSVKVENEEQ